MKRSTLLLLCMLILIPSVIFSQWKMNKRLGLGMTMSNSDTLSTADQANVDSLAWKAAKIVIEVLNNYGSNAGGLSRKNWGALHIYDGDAGTKSACGISERMLGDSTFALHIITGGDHSSGIKVAGTGDHANHRLINLLMSPDATTSTSHVGLLIRNASEFGVPIDIETGSDAEALKIVHRDTSATPAAKAIVSVEADSTIQGDYVCMGLDISGTALKGTADRYIKMTDYDGSGNYWGLTIKQSNDELLFYYNNTKVAGISTDGTYTDYVP